MKMKLINSNIKILGLVALFISSMTSCKQEDELSINPNGVRPNVTFVGLTNTNTVSTGGQLIRYNASNVNQIVGAAVSISGLQTGESILAIDYRPATGILYGISNQSRLYILNPLNGNARAVNSTPFTPALATTVGIVAGFDFDPTLDFIRLITKTGQNYRLNPNDGTILATDGAINSVSDAVLVEAAYTNNLNGSNTTELYNLDLINARLYKQVPNTGALTTVGSLGIRPITINTDPTFSTAYNTNITNFRNSALAGFDIAPNGEALAVFTNQNGAAPAIPIGGITAGPPANPSSAVNAVPGNPTLFQINLATGKAIDLGVIPLPAPNNGVAATALIGLAIAPAPVGYAIDDANNNLLIFNLTKPEPVSKTISGLQANETIVGLDFRPLNGQLYALGNSSRVYVINPATGAATVVGTLPLVPLLSGTSFGFDFIPNADLIRIVSNTGQNLRVSPTTGLVSNIDAGINGSNSVTFSATAYNNNLLPSSNPVFFVMNTTTDSLYRINDAANGRVTRVGKLNVTADAANGFDVGAVSNTAYAILTKGTETRIYTINLSLGSANPGVVFPRKVRAFTVGLGF
ncbi:DUF4394 domain-containing protein [Pedobacter aquae]|uniref:DUF4394 domain-containing protein n=1 Tax=Pedobacter aquae TaxID=2605747 RepID=A0A5C0VIJ5_9SPHI|nr:DUF4394 domain-containing protein [Pedobacter aquae]QEK51652.1 DUF4394 domain-containing protein [Pedobacter aquae]